jgi:hypothetical protein
MHLALVLLPMKKTMSGLVAVLMDITGMKHLLNPLNGDV